MKSLISILLFLLFLPLYPDSVPSDFSLEYKNGGGMRPRSESLNLSLKECRYKYFDIVRGKNINKEVSCSVSAEEIHNLYNLFVKNNFDRITYTDKGHVNDRGGIQLLITAGGKSFTIYDYYSYFVDENWYTNWNTITSAIAVITEKERKKLIKLNN